MNRNEEYMDLMNELDAKAPSSLSGSVAKAKKKRMRRQVVVRSASTMAAVCAMFVLLVNVSEPIAQAASKVPILSELVDAVKFSESLTKAVEKEHVQMLNIEATQNVVDETQNNVADETQAATEVVKNDSFEATKNSVKVEIPYIIGDEKQVNIFYRATSDVYPNLQVGQRIMHVGSYTGVGTIDEEGGYNCWRFSFEDGTPENFTLTVVVKELDAETKLPVRELATFDFDIKLDPELMGKGKTYTINKTMELNGQTLNITDLQVFPTHMRLNVEASKDRTATLKFLDYYVKTDNGMTFGNPNEMSTHNGYWHSMLADTPFFYETEPTELVITGAKWSAIPCYNIATGECTNLPDFVELVSAKNDGETLELCFKATDYEKDIFAKLLYRAEVYGVERYSFTDKVEEIIDGCKLETFTFNLENFNHDEIFLSLLPKCEVDLAEEIVIPLQ